MFVLKNLIRYLNNAYVTKTAEAYRKRCKMESASKITVTIQSDYIPPNIVLSQSIVKEVGSNGPLRLQDGIRKAIIDCHHLNEAIRILRESNSADLAWTREPLLVSLSSRVDGRALSAKDITKNRKLLNLVAA